MRYPTAFFLLLTSALFAPAADRPNILWLTSEDHGPHMGCYGDEYATTPHVDALAAKGLTYLRAWSNAPVCAPARTTIISGLYPTSTGALHMRSVIPPPAGKPTYPVLLRAAGYYCTNNVKTDYNLILPEDIWDESSSEAHWHNRPADQPFFAIFNSVLSHESRVRARPHDAIHDPAKVPLPPYLPDDPAIRRDWAQYYDVVSQADAAAGERLAELAAAGLAEDTIVFYYSDHGAGLPSHKRNPNNRGLQVAMVVYIPEKFAHLRPSDYAAGGQSERLVTFVDLAPTLLSLAGEVPPAWMQGNAFLGEHIAPAPEYAYGFRGRMDERFDNVRSVTDGRFVYVRNFRPDLPAGQHVAYQFVTDSTRVWYEHFKAGRTDPVQSAFWLPTPPEELYDLKSDPHEIHNLATDPAHRATADRLATALFQHMAAIRDLAFIPEAELHRLTAGVSPYDWARDGDPYDFDRLQVLAGEATLRQPRTSAHISADLTDADSLVRYWALRGLALGDPAAIPPHRERVRRLLRDPAVDVRVLAADVLIRHGEPDDTALAWDHLSALLTPTTPHYDLMAALTVIDNLGGKAAPLIPGLAAFPGQDQSGLHQKLSHYVPNLLTHILDASTGHSPP